MNSVEIKEFRNKYNLTQSELAEITKSSLSAVRSWEQGQRNMPQSIIYILEIWKEERDEYISNNSNEYTENSDSIFVIPKGEKPTGYYYPDVVASAGLNIGTLNDERERLPIYLPNFGKEVTYINVYGDSMCPKYNSGEIIGVKFIEYKYLNYGYAYVVVLQNGDTHIKYVKKGSDKNHVILESENDFYQPREFHLRDIKSFYAIVGVIKKEMM